MAALSLHELPVRLLGDLVSPRSVERMLQEEALARGTLPEHLDAASLTQVLKGGLYRRLLQSVPPPLAKKRVLEVIEQLESGAAQGGDAPAGGAVSLAALEEEARRFSLYFDWPETQRLRGVLGIARTEEQAGRSGAQLLREGQALIEQMGRRLQEGLVMQAGELAEFKEVLTRAAADPKQVGSKEIRRLETLVGQLEEAQGQGVLLSAELERAQTLSFKLRRNLESDETPLPDTLPTPETQTRVQALEQAEATRQLTALAREFGPLLRARPDLGIAQEGLRTRLSEGKLSEKALAEWREELSNARAAALAEQLEEYRQLAPEFGESGLNLGEFSTARVTLDVARLNLESGKLATDELRDLRAMLSALKYSPQEAARILEQQRELADLERTAREVPGGAEEMAAALNDARTALARGQATDLAPLWAALERQMGRAAQQREDFDARADFVIEQYDEVRSLAGETIQRLGRFADALRAQRRLGPMSSDARERYAQTLTDAEALLNDAHAEYAAAQRVTSTFGADALSDLLDVFDMGAQDALAWEKAGAPAATPTAEAGALSPSAPEPASPARRVADEPLAVDEAPHGFGGLDAFQDPVPPVMPTGLSQGGGGPAAPGQSTPEPLLPAPGQAEPPAPPAEETRPNPTIFDELLTQTPPRVTSVPATENWDADVAPAPTPEPTPVPTPAPAAASPDLAFAGLEAPNPAPAAPVPPQPAPVELAPVELAPLELPGGQADIWQMAGGQVLAGRADPAGPAMAGLLAQAQALGLHRLDMGDAARVWSARAGDDGIWRVARADDWDTLDDAAGPWLDTGRL